MEKHEEKGFKKPVPENLHIQDPEVYQEKEDSDDLQSNQLEINEPTESDLEDFLQSTKENEEFCAVEERLKQETDVNAKQKVEGSSENFLVRKQDLMQTIQLEADAIHQYDKLAENVTLEPEKDISLQQRVESIEEILVSPAQDSISIAEHDSNDAAQQEWDRSAENEQLKASMESQQRSELPRKFLILSSKLEGLEQPGKMSEDSVQIRKEQDIITQPENATPDKVSETPKETQATQSGAQDQEVMQREQELKKMLADYFSKQNQVMMQQRTESPIEILITPTQDSIPTAEHESDNMAQQDLDRIDKSEQLETNAASQRRSEQPRKLLILSSKKEGLQKTCEVSEDVQVKEQGMVKQQESATSDKVSKTQAGDGATQYDTQDQESMQREREMKKMLAEYFSKQNQVNQQKAEVCHQTNTHNFDNSEEAGPEKLKETITYGELEYNWSGYPRELGCYFRKCHSEPEVGVRGKSQESKEDSAMRQNPETKENKGEENGAIGPVSVYKVKPVRSQSSKDYVTFHRRESEDITARLRKLYDCLPVPRRSDDATVRPQKTKDYVTFLRRDPTVTARSPKTKDYVTLRPRKPDNETLCTKISTNISPSSESKGYVTAQPIEQNEPAPTPASPTHVFWPVRRIQEYASNPDPSIPIDEFIQSLLEEPFSPEPPLEPLGTQQLKKKMETPSPPNRKHSRQSPIPPREIYRPIPEDESFPLEQFEEVGPETTVETKEPAVHRNRRILKALVPPLSAGLQDFVQRFCERHVPAERQASFKKLITGCMLFLYSLLVGGIVTAALYFGIAFIIRAFDISGSNVTTSGYNSRFNLNVIVPDAKHHRQPKSKSLDRKVNVPGKSLGITEINSNVDFTTLVANFDVHTANSLANLDSETIPVMNGLKKKMNTLETISENNMATLVTSLDVNLINFDFGDTTPLNDFDVNLITPLTDLDINVINHLNATMIIPVTDLNVNFTTCETCNREQN